MIDSVSTGITKWKGEGERFLPWKLWLFALDQLLHLAVITGIWLLITGQFTLLISEAEKLSGSKELWILLFIYLSLTLPSSSLIARITERWSRELMVFNRKETTGLNFAGKWIGIMERMLVFTFIITGEFSGVGFLLAAKSVFRIGDLKETSDRLKTEYIIMGTLLSFSIAVIAGLGYRHFAGITK